MDWHSSGITTGVMGALKRGLGPLEDELGIHVCGGRGKQSRRTPEELTALGDRLGIDAPALTQASRLVAKVDSAAVQDGFDLYLHGFFVTDEGQLDGGAAGDERGQAPGPSLPLAFGRAGELRRGAPQCHRRARARPHHQPDRSTRAAPSHSAQLDLLGTLGPAGILDEYEVLTRQASAQAQLPHLVKPSHHDVRAKDVFTRRREERARCAGGALDGAASALGDGYQDGR